MRGRPRKAQVNEVVNVWRKETQEHPWYGVVVDYRIDVKWGRYGVIHTDALGRNPKGPIVWTDATDLTPLAITSKRPGIVYRHNERLGGDDVRGCRCNCCHHVRGTESEPTE